MQHRIDRRACSKQSQPIAMSRVRSKGMCSTVIPQSFTARSLGVRSALFSESDADTKRVDSQALCRSASLEKGLSHHARPAACFTTQGSFSVSEMAPSIHCGGRWRCRRSRSGRVFPKASTSSELVRLPHAQLQIVFLVTFYCDFGVHSACLLCCVLY